MKKHLFSWMSIVLMAFVCVGFAACGSDDDGNGGSGSSSSGVEVSSNMYGFYNGSSNAWEFYFSNYDLSSQSVPNSAIDLIVIDLVVENATDDIPVGEFTGCFAVDIAKGMSPTQEGKMYESGRRSTTTGKLTITKSGDNYTVSYSGVDFYGDDSNTPTVKGASFSYTGKLRKLDNLPSSGK